MPRKAKVQKDLLEPVYDSLVRVGWLWAYVKDDKTGATLFDWTDLGRRRIQITGDIRSELGLPPKMADFEFEYLLWWLLAQQYQRGQGSMTAH